MTDRDLIKFCFEFREGILDGSPSKFMCFAVCSPLATLLGMHDVPATLKEADIGECQHYWMELDDGRVIDPTADQFNDTAATPFPPVYLGVPTEYHRPYRSIEDAP